MRCRFVVPVVLAALALTGCSSGAEDEAASSPSARPGACEDAVAALLASGQQYLDSLGGDAASPSAPASPRATATDEPDPTERGDRFATALADLQRHADQVGCDAAELQDRLVGGLRELRAGGPVAEAVQARLAAQLAGARPSQAPLTPGDDVVAALAAAPDGGTVRLGAGRFDLDDGLVLLRGVTLEGAGRDATVLAAGGEAGTVLVLTGEPVTVRGLALEHVGAVPASVLTAGPGASLVLEQVRASGAVAEPEGGGGAGVLMSAGAGGQTGATRRTTVRMTDVVVSGNGSAGVLVNGDHRVELVRVVATGSSTCGVCLLGTSDGTVQESEVADNAAGVVVAGAARPVVRGVTVRGGEVGVQVLGTSSPELDGVTVAGASRAAVVWGDTASGSARRTTCTDVPFGIVVGPQAAPTVEDNTCALARGQ